MYYEKNLKLISARFPFLLKELNTATKNPNLIIETVSSKTGPPVARIVKNGRQIYLNSPYNPELEAERWAERHAADGKSALFIFGGGFLYHLKAMLKKGCYKKVVCYEPSPELLKECLHKVDLTGLQNCDFLLVTGGNYTEVTGLISEYLMFLILENQMEVLPNYQELFGEEIVKIQEMLWESVRINRLNLATSKMSGSKWLINGAYNSRTIINSPGIRCFFNKFNGVPAVIVSAGPSLAKNIHLLKKLKEKAVIICAGTSIRAMQKYGVTPHFIVAFDGAYCNEEIYSNLKLDDICLIYSYRFNYRALQLFTGKKVYMKLDTDTFSDYLSLKCGGYDFGTIRSGFSVAHSALDIAIKMGCGPVILIGQDLAYTGNQKYAENLHMTTVDSNNLPPEAFYTKDINGKDIVTDRKLDSMRLLFELMVAEYYKEKAIINATEGGQPIKGVPNRKLAEVINDYCHFEKDLTKKIDLIYNSSLQEIKDHSAKDIRILQESRSLALHGFFKMEALITQIDQTRKALFFDGIELEKIPLVLAKTDAEFQTFINQREWQLLLKDVIDSKISPNQIAIERLGEAKDRETYYTKSQYWLNILMETSLHLRYIISGIARLLNKAATDNRVVPITQIADTGTWRQFEARIRNSAGLDEIQRQLETIIKQDGRNDIDEYQYLYGLVLSKTGQLEKAYDIMNKLVIKDNTNAKAWFLAYRIVAQLHFFNISQFLLKKCLELNYKSEYCKKMLIITAFRAKEYMVVNNYISEFENQLQPRSFYMGMRVACLASMKLYGEAEKAYQALIDNHRLRPSLRKRLADLLANRVETDFERTFQSNIAFFKDRGLEFEDYPQARFKNCLYLNGEYIYDSQRQRFMPVPDEIENDTLEIVVEDTLLICDTDNVKLYQQLKDYLKKDRSEAERQKILLTPIFVVEHQVDHWQLLMQKFDFTGLSEWRNLHFLIGIEAQDLERLYQDVSVPLPNVLYGTNLDEIKLLLEKVKAEREVSYRQGMESLKEYYQSRENQRCQKVLVVTSIADQVAIKYGEALVKYLTEQGYECKLNYEKPPYYKFSKYSDLTILKEFLPDLVVHLFALQEELEACKDLAIPFIHWRLADRPLTNSIMADCPLELILVHGDQKSRAQLVSKGFQGEQIREIPLPFLPRAGESMVKQETKGQVAIIADIKEQRPIVENLATIILGILAGQNYSKPDIIAVFNTIYFKIYTQLLNQGSFLQNDALFSEIIEAELIKSNLEIGKQMTDMVTALFRRELEDTIMTIAQVNWVLNAKEDYDLRLYGKGWGHDPSFNQYFQGNLEPLSDQYQQTILGNKIILYTGLFKKNGSLMQSDLINGIAAGGFFLANGCFTGEPIMPPFGGLLEIYRNKAELLQKLDYYLNHERERLERVDQLRKYIRENHRIENFGILLS